MRREPLHANWVIIAKLTWENGSIEPRRTADQTVKVIFYIQRKDLVNSVESFTM